MTINERMRHLRKDILKLTQEEFARKLRVSTSNGGNLETNRSNLTERTIADICREWSISEKWLVSGEEPVFCDNADPFTHKIVDIYESLNPIAGSTSRATLIACWRSRGRWMGRAQAGAARSPASFHLNLFFSV